MTATSMAERPVLEAVSITVAGPARPILDAVGLQFAPGRLVGLIGPNGAGKTTLLRLLAGLSRPDRGMVRLGGCPIHDLPAMRRARCLSYLAQGGQAHWPLGADAVVALGRLPHGDGTTPADRAAIARAMALTGTTGFAGRRIDRLSGGETVRVLLARALAVEAPVLLVDEPVAALDPAHQLDVMTVLADQARQGAVVIAVLHDLSLAARFCDRLVLLTQGRVLADGDATEVLAARHLATAYGIHAWRGEACGRPLIIPWARIGRADDAASIPPSHQPDDDEVAPCPRASAPQTAARYKTTTPVGSSPT